MYAGIQVPPSEVVSCHSLPPSLLSPSFAVDEFEQETLVSPFFTFQCEHSRRNVHIVLPLVRTRSMDTTQAFIPHPCTREEPSGHLPRYATTVNIIFLIHDFVTPPPPRPVLYDSTIIQLMMVKSMTLYRALLILVLTQQSTLQLPWKSCSSKLLL